MEYVAGIFRASVYIDLQAFGKGNSLLPVGKWCEVAEVKLQLSGSHDYDEGLPDDGISCHEGWGFLRTWHFGLFMDIG